MLRIQPQESHAGPFQPLILTEKGAPLRRAVWSTLFTAVSSVTPTGLAHSKCLISNELNKYLSDEQKSIRGEQVLHSFAFPSAESHDVQRAQTLVKWLPVLGKHADKCW